MIKSFGRQDKVLNDRQLAPLKPSEILLILKGPSDKLLKILEAGRVHAADANGNTPLHIAARKGDLATCELFIRYGANPQAQNKNRQRPGDLASAAGHSAIEAFLTSIEVQQLGQQNGDLTQASQDKNRSTSQGLELTDLTFTTEVPPEEFFCRNAGEKSSGVFVALPTTKPVNDDRDWDIDLSHSHIVGEGIDHDMSLSEPEDNTEFLKTLDRGRRSVRQATVKKSTRLSIDLDTCISWSKKIISKGWCSEDELNDLVSECEGNGDPDELFANIKRILEVAGLECVDGWCKPDLNPFDNLGDVSSEDLAEAIEAALTRATRQPGTQRFAVTKSRERQLLEPLIRAKQELQIGALANEAAVATMMDILSGVRDGSVDPADCTLKSIMPSRSDHPETVEFLAAVEAIENWRADGHALEGKRRREALAAVESLDLSLTFYKEVVRRLEHAECKNELINLNRQISAFEKATQDLIMAHLPYARRFSARNVEDEEDPEDVFQVSFTGLHRSARRFDPERGHRFVVYCTFWMQQSLTRWRADEGALIRIPVHRREDLNKLEHALERLDADIDGVISDTHLAAELEWTLGEVQRFRTIPRLAVSPDNLNEWEQLMIGEEYVDPLELAEIKKIVSDALHELREREADVMRKRFGIGSGDEMTLEEIGQLYGLTRERIRQIEVKGFRTLSHPGRIRRMREQLGK